jgi:hypothetical protein
LSHGNYTQALSLLEACQSEGIFSPEIAELIDFTRQESVLQQNRARIQSVLKQAQELMASGAYESVVELLSPMNQQTGTSSLQPLLEEAKTQCKFRRDLDDSLRTAEGLMKEEHYEAAVSFLKSQSPAVLNSELVQSALKRMSESLKHESTALQAVGRGYAALDIFQMGTAESSPPQLDENGSEASLLGRIVPLFAYRRKSIADRQLSSAVEQLRTALKNGDGQRAAEVLETAPIFHAYASSNVQSEWSSLAKKAGKNKIIKRLGVRSS